MAFENSPFRYGAQPQGYAGTQVEVDQGLRSFMLGVYNNMTVGLGISGLVALGLNMLSVAAYQGTRPILTPFGQALYTSPLKWVLMLAPLAFIFVFSFRMDRMSSVSARTMFWAFAAVMGASMSTLLLVFTGASVVRVFFITAATFGALSLYGYTTKRSLSGMGSFLIMGVIGLVIASLVNIFLASSALQFAISVLGVLIFAGLTAYDTQKLKEMYLYSGLDAEGAAKMSVNGALTLYLDFINMFQFLLSLLGDRR
ncbi:Bax inhibitor-1/YccA family protein [Methylobacterium organophilum]|uniref:Bax inhibitor-1/YccA family protein n=1 Tax=Methylobacterium organophilum TaxID=410 RepID=UPI001F1321DB|nr:Bax inhibitor-1/YccA family protein [Methylobacterium organophilum]UMY17203.1 Bax inhibitor-1/YccA family protein [Methylobacterium organophilum]